jgi:hypothetical protein
MEFIIVIILMEVDTRENGRMIREKGVEIIFERFGKRVECYSD